MTHRIIELRQYTLHPRRRDELIELFDREFVETQEATGITVIGQFRDLDAPDRFVWLRSFPDMESRRESLAAFYGGPVWKEYRDAANATMIDSNDVLLLRPVDGLPGFPDPTETTPERPGPALPHAASANEEPARPITATNHLGEPTTLTDDERDRLQNATDHPDQHATLTSNGHEHLQNATNHPDQHATLTSNERDHLQNATNHLGQHTTVADNELERLITATIHLGQHATFADDERGRLVTAAGFGYSRTEYAENTFPALPVRTGEHAFVSFTRHAGPLVPIPGVRTQRLRLTPTPRSRLR
ncbi:NIPSNAP family protein [Paractinoplanes maris]|uniref:NIPSNAP family protein n=1 Tax=Paractinoplanes maris TaxID=1734446 RepID=UPI002020A80F|nr:NIPSNAP family protein [Actinoplanes maris]